MEPNLDTLLVNLSEQSALTHRKRSETITALIEEATLMKRACEGIDILNLRRGPFTNTVLVKVDICKEILAINGEGVSPLIIKRINTYLDDMKLTIDLKFSYGEKLDKYLEQKENDIIEVIRSNLLEADLDEYEEIRDRLVFFKNMLINLCDKVLEEASNLK